MARIASQHFQPPHEGAKDEKVYTEDELKGGTEHQPKVKGMRCQWGSKGSVDIFPEGVTSV